MSEEKKTEVAATDSGRVTIKLSKPARYEDVEKTELVLDFDGLSGDDIANAYEERIADHGHRPVVMPELDARCQAYVAAKAAGVPAGMIMKLGAGDFNKTTKAARDFLNFSEG